MANKESHSEKDVKNFYKSEISRLEKELKSKENTIYNLRCRIKGLENQIKRPKNKQKTPADKRQSAILNAREVRDKLAIERKPKEKK